MRLAKLCVCSVWLIKCFCSTGAHSVTESAQAAADNLSDNKGQCLWSATRSSCDPQAEYQSGTGYSRWASLLRAACIYSSCSFGISLNLSCITLVPHTGWLHAFESCFDATSYLLLPFLEFHALLASRFTKCLGYLGFLHDWNKYFFLTNRKNNKDISWG